MIESGTLAQTWYAGGPERGDRPDFQVHAYNDDLYILRQAAFSNFEKPFLYLIFGRDRAILFDTGAGSVDLAGTIDRIVRDWLARNRRSGFELVVAHTHGHRDHIAGDDQFRGRSDVTFVAPDLTSVQRFYGFDRWPDQSVTYDLGDRPLDLIPVPGHEPSSIAIYDRRTALLLTGDLFYPGRLYVRDGEAFTKSVRRLVEFTAHRPVTHFLGAHIENQSAPFEDYPDGTVDQPDEHRLELDRAQLLELDRALQPMHYVMSRLVMRDFTIWPVVPT